MLALNLVLQSLPAGEIVDRKLNVASGRYRSRFCNDSALCIIASN